ncbi:hypothetical protein, partial [Providencia rettgeri]
DNIGAILSIIGLVISIILTPPINLKISFRKFSLLLAIFSFIIYIILNNIFIKSDIGYLTGGYWWIYLFVSILLFPPPSFNVLNIISKYVIVTSIIILSIDLYYRFFINPIDKENIGRYAFKFGIIDADSNFSGIYSSLMFFYCLFLVNTYQKYRKCLVVLYILVVSSLSVAAISVTTIMYFYFKSTKKIKIYSILPLLFLSIILSPVILGFIENDASGLTKINFISAGLDIFLSRSFFDELLGTGFSSVTINGLEPHIVVLQIILQLGIIGLILYYLIQVILLLGYSGIHAYIIIPFFLIGFSVASISNPIFTLTILLLYYHSYYIEGFKNKSYLTTEKTL